MKRTAYLALGVLLSASLAVLAQVAYNQFSPGGALSGTWNSQNVNLAAGSPFITGVLPAANTAAQVGVFDATVASGGVTVNNSAGLGTVAGTRSTTGTFQITYSSGTVNHVACSQRNNGGSVALYQVEGLGSGVINFVTFSIAGSAIDTFGSLNCITSP